MTRLVVACTLLSVGLASLASASSANNQPPSSNPQALAYATQSVAAMTGGTVISDVTLTGNVTWTAGSNSETGTSTLMALGTSESRMDLVLPSGTRTEIRDASTGTPLGKWTSQSGASGKFAFHNCQTDAVWFFPATGSLTAGPNVVLSYIGQENRNGQEVQHLQSYVYQPNPTPGTSSQQLSTMDFYLDATTLLPSAVTFNAHPDNDAMTNLLIEVDFSNYQNVNGVMVPMHIQRFWQGNLSVDMTVTSSSFNTGLSLSEFAVN